MAGEWIAGRGDLPDADVVHDMPRDMGGLEAGFLSTMTPPFEATGGVKLVRQIRRRRNWRWRG